MKKVIIGIIVTAIVVGAVFYFFPNLRPKYSGNIGIDAVFYDADGQPLGNVKSIVITPSQRTIEGVTYMRVKPWVRSTAERDMSIKIVEVQPSELTSLFPTDSLQIQPGQVASWLSSMIDVRPYEGRTIPLKITFEATWQYAGETGKLRQSTPTYVYTVNRDPIFGFEVGVAELENTTTTTTTPPSQTTTTSIPPTTTTTTTTIPTYVNFRTNSLSYPTTGGAVAYAPTCGQTLTQYGVISVFSSSGYTCESQMSGQTNNCGTSPTKRLSNLPGSFSGYGPLSLWQGTDPTKVCICATESDGSGFRYTYYSTTDSDASGVLNTPLPSTPTMELTCTP